MNLQISAGDFSPSVYKHKFNFVEQKKSLKHAAKQAGED